MSSPDSSLASRYLKVPLTPLHADPDAPLPPLPPRPQKVTTAPPGPPRTPPWRLSQKDWEYVESNYLGPVLSKPSRRDWTIDDLKVRYSWTINRMKRNQTPPDEIEKSLLILHRYLILDQENEFDVDVTPYQFTGNYIIPVVCSKESDIESYNMFADLSRLAIENYNNLHSEDFEVEKPVRMTTWKTGADFRMFYLTFHATGSKQTAAGAVQIFRARVVLQVDQIKVVSCEAMV